MFTFSDATVEELGTAAQQTMVVDTLGAGRSELSKRDLPSRITADNFGTFALLEENYNSALENVQAAMQQVSERYQY